MTQLVNDVVARLFLNSDWRDISSDIRASGGVDIQRGRKGEDTSTPPQTCEITLNNESGDYTERDPMGTWYGYLGRNTPLEVSLRLAKDTATTTASSSWGSTDTHVDGAWRVLAWTNSGGSASDFNKASGKATHLISTANDSRYSWVAGLSQRDIDFTVTMSLAFTNVTGGTVGADFFMRGTGSIANYYAARVLIQTDESVTIDITDIGGVSLTGGAVTIAGLTHSSSQALKFRMQAEGQTIRAKVWAATASEPYAWQRTVNDDGSTTSTLALRDAPGFVGIRSITGAGNTNVPVTFSYDDIEIREPMFYGEVSEWPQTRDVSGTDKTVSVEASGVMRRLGQGQSPLLSSLRRYLSQDPVGNTLPDHYWPLEDEIRAVAEEVLAVRGSTGLVFLQDSLNSGTINWAADKSLGGSLQSPELRDGGRLEAKVDPTGKSAGWTAFWVMKTGIETGAQVLFYTASSVFQFTLIFYTDGTIEGYLTETNPLSPTLIFTYGIPVGTYDDTWHDFVLRVEQSGGNAEFNLYIDGVNVASGSKASTMAGLNRVLFAAPAGTTEPVAVSHIGVWAASVSAEPLHTAAIGHAGERAVPRMDRLCTETNVSLAYIGESATSAELGAQGVSSFLDLFGRCVEADGGLLCEPRGTSGLAYRTLKSMYARTSWCSLSLANGELSPPWKPVPDDRYLRNKITAERIDGGSYTHEVTSGRLSTLAPEDGGVGICDDQVRLNVASDLQLPDQASWRTHLGTVDEERYPAVVVELARTQIFTANPTLYAKLLDLDVGDQVTLADLDATGIYEDPDQIVVGCRRVLTKFTHTLTLTCAPASGYRVFELDSAYLDDDDTTLNEALDTTESGVDVAIASTGRIWTAADQPYDVLTGGERMTVTAVSGGSSPQTLTVTRSANNVVKTHTTGAKLSLARPSYLGL